MAWCCVQAGYAVIFLHRKQSVLPFTSDFPPGSTLELLQQVLEFSNSGNNSSNSDGSAPDQPASGATGAAAAAAAGVGPGSTAAAAAAATTAGALGPARALRVRAEHQRQLGETLAAVTAVQAAGTLLSVGFETIFEYLKVGVGQQQSQQVGLACSTLQEGTFA